MFAPSTSSSKKRTRRNIIRAGAILASAVAANVAAIKTSVAQNGLGPKGLQKGHGGNGVQCLLRARLFRPPAATAKSKS